jgi:hypothetical protein
VNTNLSLFNKEFKPTHPFTSDDLYAVSKQKNEPIDLDSESADSSEIARLID